MEHTVRSGALVHGGKPAAASGGIRDERAARCMEQCAPGMEICEPAELEWKLMPSSHSIAEQQTTSQPYMIAAHDPGRADSNRRPRPGNLRRFGYQLLFSRNWPVRSLLWNDMRRSAEAHRRHWNGWDITMPNSSRRMAHWGFPKRPFDAIIVSAAAPRAPKALAEQLALEVACSFR